MTNTQIFWSVYVLGFIVSYIICRWICRGSCTDERPYSWDDVGLGLIFSIFSWAMVIVAIFGIIYYWIIDPFLMGMKVSKLKIPKWL